MSIPKLFNSWFKTEGSIVVTGPYLHSELTGKIIGCAMEVHTTLGNGFQEVIYQRALEIEMAQQGLSASREHEMDIFYKGIKIGNRRVDFFVEEKVMVEIKAVIQLEDVHLAQAINYLEAYGLEVGLLLNFGSRSLQFKRVMKPNKNRPPKSPQP
jgi:GxxExxY protein